MKQMIMLISLGLIIASCGNSGDKNESKLESVKSDSTMAAGSDSAGSSKRTDTIMNPGKGGGDSAGKSGSSGTSGTKDSTGSAANSGKSSQKGDSTKH